MENQLHKEKINDSLFYWTSKKMKNGQSACMFFYSNEFTFKDGFTTDDYLATHNRSMLKRYYKESNQNEN